MASAQCGRPRAWTGTATAENWDSSAASSSRWGTTGSTPAWPPSAPRAHQTPAPPGGNATDLCDTWGESDLGRRSARDLLDEPGVAVWVGELGVGAEVGSVRVDAGRPAVRIGELGVLAEVGLVRVPGGEANGRTCRGRNPRTSPALARPESLRSSAQPARRPAAPARLETSASATGRSPQELPQGRLAWRIADGVARMFVSDLPYGPSHCRRRQRMRALAGDLVALPGREPGTAHAAAALTGPPPATPGGPRRTRLPNRVAGPPGAY